MPAVRVIPPYEPRGLYALTAAIGLIAGPLAGLAVLRSTIPIPSSSPWNELITVFLIPAIFITIFATLCQRKRPVFLTALLFGFCFWLSFIVAQDLAQPTSGGAQILSGVWVGFLLAASIIAIITALAALTLRWIIRFLLVIYVEQTGRLCPRCAYPVDPATQSVCPECGSPAAVANSKRTLGRAARIVGRPLLVVALLGFLATAAIIISRRGYPIYRFQAALDALGERPAGFIYEAEQIPERTSTPLRVTAGAWIPFPASLLGHDFDGVIASYLPVDEPDLPAMQLTLTDRLSQGTYSEVRPRIICSLSRAQADFVIKHGVPLDLLAAFRKISSERRDYIIIDPAPYFPK